MSMDPYEEVEKYFGEHLENMKYWGNDAIKLDMWSKAEKGKATSYMLRDDVSVYDLYKQLPITSYKSDCPWQISLMVVAPTYDDGNHSMGPVLKWTPYISDELRNKLLKVFIRPADVTFPKLHLPMGYLGKLYSKD